MKINDICKTVEFHVRIRDLYKLIQPSLDPRMRSSISKQYQFIVQ